MQRNLRMKTMRLVFLCILGISLPAHGQGHQNIHDRSDSNLPAVDWSKGSWIQAFDNLHNTLRRQYAFTNWKNINWSSRYQTYRPRIVSAEGSGDMTAFIVAIREYVFSIPDGHMECLPSNNAGWNRVMQIMRDHIGGSYGFALVELDNGKIVVSIVTEDSPAHRAGMEIGAEILEWKGKSLSDALEDVSELWAYNPGATREVKKLNTYRFIGRDPTGTQADVIFKNPSAAENIHATLTAVDDNYRTYYMTHFFPTSEDYQQRVRYEILDSGYGYVRVVSEGYDYSTSNAVKEKFREAIQHFVDRSVPAVILDFRKNAGGLDETAAYMAGFFYGYRAHYEYITYYSTITGNFEITDQIDIEARTPHFDGPVIAMVGPGTISSGEGPPMAVQKLPLGEVVSFYGSNGSFGMAAGSFALPCDIEVTYTNGQSLDVNRVIQLDGDADLNGGVLPDIRVPLDEQTFHEKFVEGKDVELDFVIRRLNEYTGVNERAIHPDGPVLQQNYPNPFNASTVIRFFLPVSVRVRLEIYNMSGQHVETLIDAERAEGRHSVVWNADGLSGGVYLCRLRVGEFVHTKKLIYQR